MRCVQRRLFAALLAAFLCLSIAAVARAQAEWYDHYDNAERALRDQHWKDAAASLVEAIRLKPVPGVGQGTYGMKYVNYFPYFKLGIAYYNLGDYDAALQAFASEERAGAVQKSAADWQNLTTFRGLAQEAKKKAGAVKEDQVRRAVAQNIESARQLERDGRLPEAMAAALRAVALDAQSSEARSLVEHLRASLAVQQREKDAEARRTKLLEDGRTALGAGHLDEAADLFGQALAIRSDPAVQGLLDGTQARIRAQIEAGRTAAQREQLVRDALSEAKRLEGEKRYEDAMRTLQPALAIEPDNIDVVAIQKRLRDAKAKADGEQKRTDEIAIAMNEGVGDLQRGLPELAAAAFNRILALDPENKAANENLLQAFQAMNRLLTGGAPPTPKIVPIIVLTGRAAESANGSTETVREPVVAVAGLVLDDGSEMVLRIESEHGSPVTRKLAGQKTDNLYRFEFSEPLDVRSSGSLVRVTATDADRLSGVAERRYRYVVPWHRSPWVLGAFAAILLATSGGVALRRARVRTLALKRRFNPFVAGTPVLNEDAFFGREPLMQRILQSIHNNSILLYGERRIGKTSIQHHLHKRLLRLQDPDYEFFPVYIDLQGVPQERFFSTLAADILNELSERVDSSYASRDPRAEEGYGYEHLVRDLRPVLKALKTRTTKKIKMVLLIDEVDELNDYDPRVNQKLRSLFMKSFAEDLSAVVSGVAIKRHWESEGSPWYNFFEEIEVKALTRQDAIELIEKPIRGIFELEPGVTERILERTRCRPYLIQKLCMAVVSRLHDQKRRRITLEDIGSVPLPSEP